MAGQQKYPGAAIAIHWFVAACVAGLIPAGAVLARLDYGPAQERLFMVHGSIGLLVLVLTLARLGMRVAGRMPPPAAVLTPFERVASRAAHLSLYLLLLLTPAVGFLGANAYGEDLNVFGLFHAPALLAKDEELADQIFAVHLGCAILITLVIVAHVVGALVHRLRGDGVNARMLPG